jgi:hypothetical protein
MPATGEESDMESTGPTEAVHGAKSLIPKANARNISGPGRTEGRPDQIAGRQGRNGSLRPPDDSRGARRPKRHAEALPAYVETRTESPHICPAPPRYGSAWPSSVPHSRHPPIGIHGAFLHESVGKDRCRLPVKKIEHPVIHAPQSDSQLLNFITQKIRLRASQFMPHLSQSLNS